MGAVRLLRSYPYLAAALAVGVLAGALQLSGVSAARWILIAFAAFMAGRSALRMLRRLRAGAFGVDAPAVVAIVATIAVGEYWACWVIVLMLATGEALEDFAGRRARHDLSALIDRTPRVAHVVAPDGEVHDADADQVRPGDRLLIGPAELVPVDGHLIDAIAVVDESSLTGESLRVDKISGDVVLSGTVNGSVAITVLALRPAAESQYQSIVRIVEAASQSRPPLVRLADRYAVPFTVFALALAGVAWWATGDPARFAEVLVVATPCPLLVAAPVAFIAGMSRAARHGVIVKGGGAFEVLDRARAFVFDKTGMLTAGRRALVAVRAEDGFSRAEVLRLAAEAEQVSPHVLARATVGAALGEGITMRAPSHAEETPAHGVSADMDGRAVLVGKRSFVEAGTGTPVARADLEPGEMATYIAVDGRWAATLIFRDATRPDAAELIDTLRRSGVRSIAMVTGDDERTARHVAAGVGIAMGAAGSTAASESADIVLLEDSVGAVGSIR